MDINNCINWINSINEINITKIDDLINGDILLEIIGKIVNKSKNQLLEYLDESYSKIMLSNISNLVDTFFDYEFNYLSQGEQLQNNIIELINFLKSKYISTQKNSELKFEIKDNNICDLNIESETNNNFFFSNKNNKNNNNLDILKNDLEIPNKKYISSENTINLLVDANYPKKNIQKNIIINCLYPENSQKFNKNSNDLYSTNHLCQCNHHKVCNNLRNKLLMRNNSMKEIDNHKVDKKQSVSLNTNFDNNFFNRKTVSFNSYKEKYYNYSRNKKQTNNNSIQLKKNSVNNDILDENIYQYMNNDNPKYNYYNSFLLSNKNKTIINKENSKIERINKRKNNTKIFQTIKLDKNSKKYKPKMNSFYKNSNTNNQNPFSNDNNSSLIPNKTLKTIGVLKNNKEDIFCYNFIKPSKTIFSVNDNKNKRLNFSESNKISMDKNFIKSKKEKFILNSLYNLGLIEFKEKNNKYLYNYVLPNLNNKKIINAIKNYYTNKNKVLNSTNQCITGIPSNVERRLDYLCELLWFYSKINFDSRSTKNIFEDKDTIANTNENKKTIKKIKVPRFLAKNFDYDRKQFFKKIVSSGKRFKNSYSFNHYDNIITSNDKSKNISFKELLNIRKKIAYNHFRSSSSK